MKMQEWIKSKVVKGNGMAHTTVIVGLGTFGLAIGRRINSVTAEDLIGVEIDPNRRIVWETLTRKAAHSSISEVQLSLVRRILIVVRSESEVESVLQQIKTKLQKESVHPITVYVISTISKEFGVRLAQVNSSFLKIVEFPLTGGEVSALGGNLVAMAAGAFDEDERAFMKDTIASRIIDFHNYGDPAFTKLLNNVSIAYQAAALNEVMQMASQQNLDPNSVLEVISNGAASSYISKAIMHYNEQLLIKDVQLLRKTISPLPEINIDQLEEHFLSVRKLLL
jgi:3-hydroxyisobutyrate dehydrogenase-like beta-hydroxyacid dehydrogenase